MKTERTFLNIVVVKNISVWLVVIIWRSSFVVAGNDDVNDGVRVAKFDDCDDFADCHYFENVLLFDIIYSSLFEDYDNIFWFFNFRIIKK